MNQSNQDNLYAVPPKSDESTKQTDTPLPTIPSLTITEENKIPPLEEYWAEAVTDRKMNHVYFQPEVKLRARYPSILKTEPSASEVTLKNTPINSGGIKRRNLTEIR